MNQHRLTILQPSRLRTRALVIVALSAVLTMSVGMAPANATGSNGEHVLLRPASGVSGVNLPGIGASHYVYADDGYHDSFGNNSIDEFRASSSGLTYIGTVSTSYPAGSSDSSGNNIAVTGANSSHGACLVHLDSNAVESFAIDPSTGTLTEKSSVRTIGGYTSPEDVVFSPNGNYVYVLVTGVLTQILAIPIGGCGLHTPFTITPNRLYSSISLSTATRLLAVDRRDGILDVYNITYGTTLSLLTSTPSELAYPIGSGSGAIAGQIYTFNGGCSLVSPAAMEAHVLNVSSGVLGTVPNSPVFDTNPDSTGCPVNLLFTPSLGLVTETLGSSNRIASFGINGGAAKFGNETPLDSTSNYPTAQASIAGYLLVESFTSGTVSACRLSNTTGVTHCILVATLTGAGSSYPAGIGAL